MNLIIENLHVCIGNKKILNGINLIIPDGEIHAIMGPNGSGKSTLAYVLSGYKKYTITKGSIKLNNIDLLKLDPTERALNGIFLAFQHPIEIAGINNNYFLKTACNAIRKAKKLPLLNNSTFYSLIKRKISLLGMNSAFLERNLNEGFSGGEKKRNEILQMLLMEPQVTILDEIDSGLDIDALKFVSLAIDKYIEENTTASILMITHYNRLFKYIKPKKIHIIMGGKVVVSDNISIVKEIEKNGYNFINNINK